MYSGSMVGSFPHPVAAKLYLYVTLFPDEGRISSNIITEATPTNHLHIVLIVKPCVNFVTSYVRYDQRRDWAWPTHCEIGIASELCQ